MAKNILQYDLLISCPGDAEGSVKIIKEIVDEFNQQFSDVLGIGIRIRYWKDSVYAESGGKPQDLLNKQIVDTSDLAVAIFKTRFGSPTENYGSGTEEEIERMLDAGRQVFVFFDESPVSPTDIDANEFQRVQEFKEKYKDKGIFWPYKSEDEFRNVFRAHITRYFMSLSNENVMEEKSNLIVKSYKGGRVEEYIQLLPFDMGGFISSDKLIVQIQDIIEQINDMKLGMSNNNVQTAFDLFGYKKVEVEKSTVDIINVIAEQLGLVLADDFFDVGNLTETSQFTNMPFCGREIDGTEEEKTKYNAITLLKDTIYKATEHIKIEKCYKNLYGVELILCNEGTRCDEDIDVEIVLPKDRYIDVEELPVPSEKMDLAEDRCFEDIFEIPTTKDFVSYSDTKKKLSGMIPGHVTPVNPFAERDYLREYRESMREIFEYQIYPDGEDVIIKVYFDYVKQHQRAAFPTWIFINNPDEGLNIKYTITTKNNKNVIERQIEVMPRDTLKDTNKEKRKDSH